MRRLEDGPAEGTVTEHVENDGELKEAGGGRDIGGVGKPRQLSGRRANLPLQEIGGSRHLGDEAAWSRRPAPVGGAKEPLGAHEVGEALLPDAMAGVAELGEEPPVPSPSPKAAGEMATAVVLWEAIERLTGMRFDLRVGAISDGPAIVPDSVGRGARQSPPPPRAHPRNR